MFVQLCNHAETHRRLFTLHVVGPAAKYPWGLLGLVWLRPPPPLALRPRCNTPLLWGGVLTDAWLRPESPLLPPESAQVINNYFHFLLLILDFEKRTVTYWPPSGASWRAICGTGKRTRNSSTSSTSAQFLVNQTQTWKQQETIKCTV